MFRLAAGGHSQVSMLPLRFSLRRASELPTIPTLGFPTYSASPGGHLRFRFAVACSACLRYRPLSALTSTCSVLGHSQSDAQSLLTAIVLFYEAETLRPT